MSIHYNPHNRQVTYDLKSHDRGAGRDSPRRVACPALDFLAALCTHIPDAAQQLIRYYGQGPHVRRARPRSGCLASAQSPPSPDAQNASVHSIRRSWARLIKKVYEADPLICSRCGRLPI